MAQGNTRPEKRDISFKLGANESLSPAIPARSLEARKLSVNRKRCVARTLSIMLCLLEGLHQRRRQVRANGKILVYAKLPDLRRRNRGPNKRLARSA